MDFCSLASLQVVFNLLRFSVLFKANHFPDAPSSGSGHDPAEIINTAVGAAAATSKALAVTGALPKIKDATHKGVQKVKTTLNNVKAKAHTAETKVQLGGEELRNKLSFHKPEDGVNTDGVNTDDFGVGALTLYFSQNPGNTCAGYISTNAQRNCLIFGAIRASNNFWECWIFLSVVMVVFAGLSVARRRGRPPAFRSNAKETEEQEPDSPVEIVQVTPRPKPRLILQRAPEDMTAIPDDSEAAELLMELSRPSGDKSVPTQEEEKVNDFMLWGSNRFRAKGVSGVSAGSKSPTPSLKEHQKEPLLDGKDSTHSDSDSDEPEALEITYEVEKDGLVHDFSVMNTASFSTFLCTAARMLGVSITHLGSLGYIPSFLPKNPKPLPRALNSDDAYEKMLEKIEEYVLTAKSRNKGKGVVKAFSIRLVDSSGNGDVKKDKNEKKNGKSKDGDATPALDIDPNDKEHAIHKELENHYICDSHPKCVTQAEVVKSNE
ncbi:hypothetical protein GGU11DRAFT_753307, partial [Lentinula aff. detonsa]